MEKKILFFLKYLAAILIIVYILKKIDLSKVFVLLKDINYFWLGLDLLVYLMAVIITSYGLKVLFDSIVKIRFLEWMKYFLITFSIGLIIPGKLGEFSIIYFLRKKNVDIGASTALTVINKLITVIIFGIVALIGFFLIFSSNDLIIALVLGLLFVLGVLFLFSKLGRIFVKKMIGDLFKQVDIFYTTFDNLCKKNKDKLLVSAIVTLLRPMFNGLIILLSFKAIGVDVSLMYAILVNALTIIASLVPITPNGLGIREGIGVFLFRNIGIPLEVSVTMYFIIFVMNSLTGIIGVVYYFLEKRN